MKNVIIIESEGDVKISKQISDFVSELASKNPTIKTASFFILHSEIYQKEEHNQAINSIIENVKAEMIA